MCGQPGRDIIIRPLPALDSPVAMGRLHHILALATAAAVKRDCVCDPPYSHSKTIPVPSNLTAPLPKQLVLIKVPETGSSTTAQLLADLAARRRIPCWVPGAWKDNTPLSFEDAVEKTGKHVEKWALAHRGAGDWVSENFNQAFVIGTTRRPEARLTSWAAKHPKRPCQQGASIGLKFYGIAGSSKTNASEALAQIRQRFSSWFVLERYNESLVAFALRHRLPLGEVLPLLAKYHGGSTASALTCDAPGVRQLLDTEAAVHEHASQQLDETLAAFRHVLDVDALLKAFENALDGMMARGRWRNNSETGRGAGTTLLIGDCARECAAQALDAQVRLRFDTADVKEEGGETPAGWNFLKQYFPGDEAGAPKGRHW